MLTLHKDAGKGDKKDDHPFCPYIRAMKQNLDNFGQCNKDEERPEKNAERKDQEVHHHHCNVYCDHCHLRHEEGHCPHCEGLKNSGAHSPHSDEHRKCAVHCAHCCPHRGEHTNCDALCPHCSTRENFDIPCRRREVITSLHGVDCPVCHSTVKEQSYFVPIPLIHSALPVIRNINPYYQYNLGYLPPSQHTFSYNKLHLSQSVHHGLV
ncbi:hypothetical protein PR048_016788 [Dryococelus australis]|uniref:Uncharacterized protein n=1 Tax=Dryococelus australis TaxID=614101 RepID=A0ABQ9H7N4_9NEOP|nr:hypothetical protein PR048_016788 [Dryococelus australis]